MKSWHVLLALLVALLAQPLRAQEREAPPPPKAGILDDLYLLKDTKTRRISSHEANGANFDWVMLAPGETKTLAEISGSGVIRRFYLAPLAADRMRYRKLVLRMYWDGAKEPCVEVPLGDLFGSGLGTLRYFRSLVINVNQGRSSWDFDGMVSYFPMPFEKGARITLENDGGVEEFRIWYHVDYEQYEADSLPPNAGRFHAHWRREAMTSVAAGKRKNTTLGNARDANVDGSENYVILDTLGQGSFLGFFLTIDNISGTRKPGAPYDPLNHWYGEGDDMIFVDGEKWPPTYSGTGTEEIFNAGCCPTTEFAGPYTGYYLIENLNGDWGGKNQMYRFLIHDPVHFQKSIRVTLEHGHDNNFENDYTTTAFWYQRDPHGTFPPMPSAAERLPYWPAGVSEAFAKEMKVGQRMAALMREQKLKLTPEEFEQLQQMADRRNNAFRALRYQDFIQEVNLLESFLEQRLPQSPASNSGGK